MGLALYNSIKHSFWLTLQRAIITKRKKPLMFIQQRTHCKLLASVLFDSGSIRLTFFCAMTKNCLCHTFVSAFKNNNNADYCSNYCHCARHTSSYSYLSTTCIVLDCESLCTTIERHNFSIYQRQKKKQKQRKPIENLLISDKRQKDR